MSAPTQKDIDHWTELRFVNDVHHPVVRSSSYSSSPYHHLTPAKNTMPCLKRSVHVAPDFSCSIFYRPVSKPPCVLRLTDLGPCVKQSEIHDAASQAVLTIIRSQAGVSDQEMSGWNVLEVGGGDCLIFILFYIFLLLRTLRDDRIMFLPLITYDSPPYCCKAPAPSQAAFCPRSARFA